MHTDLERLKVFLVDSGLVSKAELDAVSLEGNARNLPLQEILISQGKLSEDEWRKAQAYVLGIPFVSLQGERIDFSVLSTIPEPVARKYNIVAYKRTDTALEVAMLDPEDLGAIEFLKKSVGLRILPRLTDTESMRQVLIQYQKSLKAEFGDIIQKEAKSITEISENVTPEEGAEALKKMAEDLPVVRIVDTLLSHAITQKASDIHVEQYEGEVVIRYRIDGILHDAMVLPKAVGPGITARVKVLSNLRLDEKRLPQDGRFKIDSQGTKVSFRVSILPTYYGEKVVMRLLPDAVKGYTLEGLGFHGAGLERIHNATRKTTGMILVTGPTGSGKSTTLYTILDILNKPDVNISTIEDPIEYQMPRINQTQVKPEIGMTFAAGLRSLMRQDPDIIMVGEIRDKETANLAINAALTGHLVLSTLHTNSAGATIPRMLDMGTEPFLLVSTINVIIAQRLVRKLCMTGKEEYRLSAAEAEKLGKEVDIPRVLKVLETEQIIPPGTPITEVPFFRPKETADCPEGYSGRIGIHEIMAMSTIIKDQVMKGATAAEIEEEGRTEGMFSMMEDGIYKAAQGITTIEEVLRVAAE